MRTSCLALAACALSACHATSHGKSGGSSGGDTGGNTGVTVLSTPASIAFSTQPPGNIAAGATFAVSVQVYDSTGKPFTTSSQQIQLVAAGNPAPVLNGVATLSTSTNGGVVTFVGLSITQAGQFTLTATLLGNSAVSAVSSSPITIDHGQAARLGFVVQPNSQLPANNFSPTVSVGFVDIYGNVDPGTNGSITVSLGQNPNGATLSGTLTQASAAGVVSFPDLQIDKLGQGYTLHVSGNGFVGDSVPFSVRGPSWQTLTVPAALSNIWWSGQLANGALVAAGPGQLFQSVDNGNTWTALVAPPGSNGNFTDYVPTSNANVLYANASANLGTVSNSQRSADGGLTWSDTGTANNILFTYNADPNTLIASGYVAGPTTPISLSTNGGTSWLSILTVNNGVADQFAGSPSALYAADANNFYASANNGSAWTAAQATPASGGWVGLRADPVQPGVVYMYGSQGLFRSKDSGKTWTQLLFVAVSDFQISNGAAMLYAVVNNVSTQALALVGSGDAGSTWQNAGWGLDQTNGGCTVHLTVDRNNPSTLYLSVSSTGACQASNAGMYRAFNGGY